jgi:two-component system sensor histidine kinase FlrB
MAEPSMTATACPAETLARPASPPAPGAAAVLAALPAGVAWRDAGGQVTPLNDAARAAVAAHPGLPAAGGHLALAGGHRLRLDGGPVPGHAGELLLLTNVTTEHRLDSVLARHQRLAALGELAATLAHQVRTPLAAALLYVGNAALPGLGEPRRADLLERAASCLRDLERLVDDMLGFARGAAPGSAASRVADVLAAVERAVAAACRPGQQVRIGAAPADAAVGIGREHLAGAVLNLVQNALQAAGPAARVSVAVRVTADTVAIDVTDNGPGIPAALRDRVCQPFFTTRADGTGLGLAVVDALLRAAGGHLEIDDHPPRGARVSLWLPRATAPAGPTGEPTP